MSQDEDILSPDELKTLVDVAIRLEKCSNTATNRDKWRQRFLRSDHRCEKVFTYMLLCEEKRQEEVLLQYQTEHKALVYACTCIYSGSTYEQMATIDSLRGLGRYVPSQSSYYRMIKRVTEAVHSCTQRSMEKARNQIDSLRFVSFDSAWVHRRKSRQCFGGVIDVITGKVIAYAIAVIKLSDELHNKQDKWATEDETIDYQPGYPQGLEVKVFRKVGDVITSNEFIEGVVKDNEHDAGGKIKEMLGDKEILVDLNHNVKHFRSCLQRQLEAANCGRFFGSLFFHMKHLLTSSDLSVEEKHFQWLSSIQHLLGNHEHCQHGDNEKYQTFELTEEECKRIKTVLKKCDKYIDLSRPGLHTQGNESLHAIKCQLASKNISWKSTLHARLAVTVLKKNEGEEAFSQILAELGIESPKIVDAYIEKKQIKRHTQHEREHNSNVMKRKNTRRNLIKAAMTRGKQNQRSRDHICRRKNRTERQFDMRESVSYDADILSESDAINSMEEDYSDANDIMNEIEVSDEYETSSDESSDIQLAGNGLCDADFESYLLAGAFDNPVTDSKYITGIEAERKKIPFTGITNDHQTCFMNSILQAIAFTIRQIGIGNFVPKGRFERSMYTYIIDLAEGSQTFICINQMTKRLLEEINSTEHREKGSNELVFGRQNDPADVLPFLCSMIDSWCNNAGRVPIFEFQSIVYCERVCSCAVLEMETSEIGGVEYEKVVQGTGTLLQLTNLGGSEQTGVIDMQELVKMQLNEIYPSRTCDECHATKKDGIQRTVMKSTPKILLLQICRNNSTYMNDRSVVPNGSIYIPVIIDGEESYAEYHLCSIVCFTGTDGHGHYFTYSITENGIVLVNDREIRMAESSDITIMERHSTFLFYMYCQSVEAEEYPTRNDIWIDDMLNDLSTRTEMSEIAPAVLINQDDILNIPDDEIEPHSFRTRPQFVKSTGNIICLRT